MKMASCCLKNPASFLWIMFIYFTAINLHAQTRYMGDFHLGRLQFMANTITVDPGPNWLGYYLNHESAYTLSTNHGLLWKGVLFTGIGAEFQQFKGKHGLSGFLSFATHPHDKRISLTGRLKIGYSHVWNQYPGGTGTMYVAPVIGVVWNVSARIGLELTTGLTWMQQSLLWPLQLGIRF